MKKQLSFLLFAFLLVIQFSGSAQQYKAAEVQYRNYIVNAGGKQDSSLLKLLKPYSDSLTKVMNEVIGFATVTLYRKQPEGLLGNFGADVMRYMGEKKFNHKIDVAVINPGGLRYSLPKGEITIRQVYEIMPFDNMIVLQQLKGSELKLFLDHTANKGGWGVSGITMKISNRQADSIYVNGQPLDMNAMYTVANTDYVANGGDYAEMLRGIPIINIGYVYRDAIIEYIRELTQQGKPVTAQLENRVSNAHQ